MSAVIHVEVLHAQELADDLQGFFVETITQKVSDAISTVGYRMRDTALQLVPVRTGYLQSTIGFEQIASWAFRLFARALYAPYVEWGTHRAAARLFMKHAVEQHRDEMAQEVDNAIASAIEELYAL
jgi:HK97 gp10 family phage protein